MRVSFQKHSKTFFVNYFTNTVYKVTLYCSLLTYYVIDLCFPSLSDLPIQQPGVLFYKSDYKYLSWSVVSYAYSTK